MKLNLLSSKTYLLWPLALCNDLYESNTEFAIKAVHRRRKKVVFMNIGRLSVTKNDHEL